MAARLLSFVLVLLLAAAGYAGFRILEAQLEADVFRERIAELSNDYRALRERYNDAVRRTAVTELVVQDGELSAVIRTADGELQVIDLPYDPSREIYIDFVVLHGRLWIRRVFDESTPPGDGRVIDPELAEVDWDAAGETHGKAAYRSLGEGRWVVDVTGDGSLGLTYRDPEDVVELAPPPPVRNYEPVAAEVRDALGAIGPGEAFRVIARRLGA
jgi:hypothetical protein